MGTRVLKGSSSQPWEQTWAWEYLRQTTAMTTIATTKTSPAVAEPTMRGSCSWSCWALEPGDREGTGEWKDGKYGLGHRQTQRVCTSLTRGLKLSWSAVLSIASYGAGTDLDHIASFGPQPIQLHRVLLAGHRGGDALTLYHQEEGGVSVGPEASQPLPTPEPTPWPPQDPRPYSQGSLTLSGSNLLVPRPPPAP